VPSTPSQRLGDYELIYELKSGGMGNVYLARKRGTGGFEKLLAIKTIRKELSSRSELRTMFLDEAQLLSRIEHPAVAQVYDFGEQDETLFLAMEYVPGISFADLVAMGTPAPVTLRLIAEVCRALHAAHELQDLEGRALEIVHRDVSPDNLMLSFDGHVKVLDFGIALMRGRQAPVTEYGTIKGKPPYLSPEQVKGERVDRRADIWSVGVVLWELLAGVPLFRGASIFEVALAVNQQEIAPPSAHAGQLPEGLDAIVLRALERDVSVRYQSAQEMADDLLAVASSIAAPSSSDFATMALKAEREQHRQWLRDVLGGHEPESPQGRPTGMLTVPAEPLDEEAERPLPAAEVAPAGDSSPLPAAASTSRGRVAVMGLLLLLLGTGGWFLTRDKEAPIAVQPATDAATLASIDVTAHFDAALVTPDAAPIDAAPAGADARRRVSTTTRPRPPKDPPPRDPPPRDPPEDPPATAGVGTITIAAEPYALVRVDGEEIGATPLFKKKFPAGTHVVELIHPDTGKVRLRKTVKLTDGSHANVIDR
jgi:serine/threonine-protein kinase